MSSVEALRSRVTELESALAQISNRIIRRNYSRQDIQDIVIAALRKDPTP